MNILLFESENSFSIKDYTLRLANHVETYPLQALLDYNMFSNKPLLINGIHDDLSILPLQSLLAKTQPIILCLSETHRHLTADYLKLGIEEVIIFPCSIDEFYQRIIKACRFVPSESHPIEPTLELDHAQMNAVVRGKPIELTRIEFSILHILMNHPNTVMDKPDLYKRIWNDNNYDGGNVLNVHIRRLRKKIEMDSENPRYILTKWGHGYFFRK